jgi:hypothetical protein
VAPTHARELWRASATASANDERCRRECQGR